jgi:hypothetical protein
MYYHTSLAVTIKKMMWVLLPLPILAAYAIIDPQQWLEALQSNYFIALGVLIVILYSLGFRRVLAEHWAVLYIDEYFIWLTISGKSAGVWWLTSSTIELRRQYRFPVSRVWVLTVKGDEGRIRYFLSDLAPADQAAVERLLETKWGYMKIPPD